MTHSKMTTDHETIKEWVEAREGRPSIVRTEGPGGILRIDFGTPDDDLEEINWTEFFEVFEDNNLKFLYQEHLEDGRLSRFNKFIDREHDPAD
ncbi:hypothetical protein [Rhizobium sp. L1K21]|uniref:hypothetical protein n=1 Tax=Rhizobium sp. L1K21 TaxID=2954933 RepID=UPI0020938610|nr:hypothetical protein [Rhizobium sp. L1K21]MCO6187820.1 hypothetical protein [Rhizobium sp. L1K21]